METVKNYFTSEFTNQASSALGESGSGISKALTAIIPTALAGILSKSTSGTEGADSIFDMAKNAISNVSGNTPLTSTENIQKGNSMFASLFGVNQPGITDAISKFAGIKDSSASSLMSMCLPPIMGLLGEHAEQNNLSASGLSGFLSSQKDHIIQDMPSGLSSLAGMLGLGSVGAAVTSMPSNAKTNTNSAVQEIMDEPKGNNWLLPLVFVVVALGLILYFSRSCSDTRPSTAANNDTTAIMQKVDTSANESASIAPESIKVKLPNGKELDANKGGIEDQLVTFLESDWKSLKDDSLKNKWFNFDNLDFNTGTAVLKPESEKQLDNITEILKAFPDAKIKIGGYTDVTGNPDANKKLSQDRADAAKNGLDRRGVGKQVTGAEGYGSQFAKYSATASEEEKATDRHVSVSVRK